MASKYTYCSLFSVLLLISQSLSYNSDDFTLCRLYEYPGYDICPSCCSNWFKTTKNTSITVVQVSNIIKALENSGYYMMPTILEKNLNPNIIHPYCHDFMFFIDSRKRFTIYGENNTITLFVPPDNSIRFEEWIDLKYQIVMGKVDREAFESGSLSKGSTLESSTRSKERLLVTQVFENGTVSINKVKITKWNIYNDGHVIVHGTEDFFNHFQGENQHCEPFWATPVLTEFMEIYEDVKTGNYTTKKMTLSNPHKAITMLSSILLLL